MVPYADALVLDQLVLSPRARALGWAPTLRSVADNASRLFEERRQGRKPPEGRGQGSGSCTSCRPSGRPTAASRPAEAGRYFTEMPTLKTIRVVLGVAVRVSVAACGGIE